MFIITETTWAIHIRNQMPLFIILVFLFRFDSLFRVNFQFPGAVVYDD